MENDSTNCTCPDGYGANLDLPHTRECVEAEIDNLTAKNFAVPPAMVGEDQRSGDPDQVDRADNERRMREAGIVQTLGDGELRHRRSRGPVGFNAEMRDKDGILRALFVSYEYGAEVMRLINNHDAREAERDVLRSALENIMKEADRKCKCETYHPGGTYSRERPAYDCGCTERIYCIAEAALKENK